MPEIIVTSGNIFKSGCAALVNPVDAATGAQGKGLAAAFKRRWPERCRSYRDACLEGRMCAGDVMLDDDGAPLILFAATKEHWRAKSQIEWVRGCLDRIVGWTEVEEIASIGIPALGCGEGGLDWSDVLPLMLDAAERMRCDVVKVYEPMEKR